MLQKMFLKGGALINISYCKRQNSDNIMLLCSGIFFSSIGLPNVLSLHCSKQKISNLQINYKKIILVDSKQLTLTSLDNDLLLCFQQHMQSCEYSLRCIVTLLVQVGHILQKSIFLSRYIDLINKIFWHSSFALFQTHVLRSIF